MRTDYRPPDGDFRWVTLAQFAAEIGRTPFQARKLLAKVGYSGIRRRWNGKEFVYVAEDLEAMKALLGQTAPPTTPSRDWLTTYLGGTPHA